MGIPVEPTMARTFTAFSIAVVFGSYGFAALSTDPNPKVPILGALVAGFGGSWLVMKGWDWLIWRASKSAQPTAHPANAAQEAPPPTAD